MTADSKVMFTRFEIHRNFLNKSPFNWKEDEDFQSDMELFECLVMVKMQLKKE